MTVKLGKELSTKRDTWGGSPQGCVTANALFCATIEDLQTDRPQVPRVNEEQQSPIRIPVDYNHNGINRGYVVPFEQNGTDTPINFVPISSSSPRHRVEEDDSGEESRIIARPLAGRNAACRIEDTLNEETDALSLTEMRNNIGMPDRWKSETE